MDKCPRCENEKLKEEYKYCPICGAILEYEVVEVSVEILKAMLIKYKAYRCECRRRNINTIGNRCFSCCH